MGGWVLGWGGGKGIRKKGKVLGKKERGGGKGEVGRYVGVGGNEGFETSQFLI